VLRKKLILTVASLVALLLLTGVGAIGVLQDTFADLRHVEGEALRVMQGEEITKTTLAHAHAELVTLTTRFRWLVLALAVVFVFVMNFAVVALLRMTGLVLRPLEKLLEATRHLGHERFDYRVAVNHNDEFDELGRAYNQMAGQLETNEQRKLEMLGQVALALNHELNNAAAIIEMQLKLLGRQTEGNCAAERYARQIHDSLLRMTRSVELLKHVRRIVLTDYVAGMKMLDLEKSVVPDESAAAAAGTPRRANEEAGSRTS
jgi:methyl-accepting chemotaxis protein